MLQFPRIPPKLRKLAHHACLPALTFALSAAQLSQSYAPCALAVVALAGPKLPGLFCLLGAAAGAVAVSQSPAAGEMVAPGTVVTVSFRYLNETD